MDFFDGEITWRETSRAGCAFAFEVTMLLTHPYLARLSTSGQKPPLHFHPYQTEYIEVLSGKLHVVVNGETRLLSSVDGRIAVQPWENHRLYPPVAEQCGGDGRTVFILSAEDIDDAHKLDTVFFQNWYGYQDEPFRRGQQADLIQVMCMFDAGGSYMSPPWWLLFGKFLSVATGIVVGRWTGSLLGYQPFYKKWTTHWEVACRKMNASYLQKRFSDGEKEE